MAADEEDRDGKIRGILTILISPVEGHAFDAGVICDMLVVVRHAEPASNCHRPAGSSTLVSALLANFKTRAIYNLLWGADGMTALTCQ
jgi:hypothetical protein